MDPEVQIVFLKGGPVEEYDVVIRITQDEHDDLHVHRSVIRLASKMYQDCQYEDIMDMATTWRLDMLMDKITGVRDDMKRVVCKQWLKLAYLAAAPYSTRIEVAMPNNLREASPLMRITDALDSTDDVTKYVEAFVLKESCALRVELRIPSSDDDTKRVRFDPIDLDVRGTYVLRKVSKSSSVSSSSEEESTYELMQVEPKQKKHVLPFKLPESALAEFGQELFRVLKEGIRVSCEVQMTGITTALLAFIQRNNNDKYATALHRAEHRHSHRIVESIHQPMLGGASTFETVFDGETMRCLPKKLLYKSFLDCILGKNATEHGLELAMMATPDKTPDAAADSDAAADATTAPTPDAAADSDSDATADADADDADAPADMKT